MWFISPRCGRYQKDYYSYKYCQHYINKNVDIKFRYAQNQKCVNLISMLCNKNVDSIFSAHDAFLE